MIPKGISRDHPRIRGEHDGDVDAAVVAFGSSPHTRGALSQEIGQVDARRIIPAYAGSTIHWSPLRWRQWDHPRIRGEHAKLGFGLAGVFGSSPHTRGAP